MAEGLVFKIKVEANLEEEEEDEMEDHSAKSVENLVTQRMFVIIEVEVT